MLPSELSDCIPGVFSQRQLQILCDEGWIHNVQEVDRSSVDLTVGDEAYLMSLGAIKPFGKEYSHFLAKQRGGCQRQEFESDGTLKLKKKQTYVFKLQQSLDRELLTNEIYGQATAKSSVGRVDVLARLIVEGMDCYESFDRSAANSNGNLFLEVTPITFDVRVKKGTALSQLRLFYGHPEDSLMRGKELFESVHIPDGCLRADLSDAKVGTAEGCTLCASSETEEEPVCLWKGDMLPDPSKYWKVAKSTPIKSKNYLQIRKERFYLLRSKEKIALPAGIAVYCRAIDETIGEMRIHYAGFVHPWFGRDRKDGQIGTPLIFEVRGHDVEVLLNDSERMARLFFYRMSEDCKKPEPGDYSTQTLQLSKFFADWK
jgi:dCTP deaminase